MTNTSGKSFVSQRKSLPVDNALYIPSRGNRRPERPRTSHLTYIQHMLGYEGGMIQAYQIAILAKDQSAWRSLVMFCSCRVRGNHFLWNRGVVNIQKYLGNNFVTPIGSKKLWFPPGAHMLQNMYPYACSMYSFYFCYFVKQNFQ